MKKYVSVFLLSFLLSLFLLCGCGKEIIAEPAPTPTPHVHSWSPANCVRPAMCAICGAEQGSALGHDWMAATYGEPRHCAVCGLTEGDALTLSPAPQREAEWPPYPLASTNIVPPSDSSFWFSTSQKRIVTAPNNAYQFSAPDDYAERFSTVKKGTIVEMIAQEGKYGLCVYRGQIIGWVRVKWLDPCCGETEGTARSQTTSAPTPEYVSSSRPSAKDLDDIGSPITYPTSYLSEYQTRTVIAEHKICVYIYYSASAKQNNRLPYDLPHLTEVTVIAEKNGLSCVIYKDADGHTRSGWVTSSHLVESNAPAETQERILRGDRYTFVAAENRWYLSQPLSKQCLAFFPVDVDVDGIDELVVLKWGNTMDSGFYEVYGARPSENKTVLITSGDCSADAFVQVEQGLHVLAICEYHTGIESDILLRIEKGVLEHSGNVTLRIEDGEALPGCFDWVEASNLYVLD